MFARIFCERDRITSRRADVRDFICRHRAADSRAVNDNSDINMIFRKRLLQRRARNPDNQPHLLNSCRNRGLENLIRQKIF